MSFDDLDRRLRRALEPPPEALERTLRQALAHRPAGQARRRRPGVWVGAAAAAVVLAAALALVWGRLGSFSPLASPAPAPPAPPQQVLTITNTRGWVTVESPSGATLVILSGGET